MEEKKLTDEEIVKDIEHSTGMPSYWKKIALDLIHRLQSENERLKKQIDELPKPRKKILANRVYSDGTLKKWRKEDLIEQIRILEHNWACAEESLNNSAKNSEKIFAEQKAEIERLTEERDGARVATDKYLQKSLELQKQVDELTKDRNWYKERYELSNHNFEVVSDRLEQAVKDRAKEILTVVGNQCEDGLDFKYYHWFDDLCKRYGVEVE